MKRLLFALIVLVLAACGGADTREEPETVIGSPPSPKDDPFFFVAMPAEAIPAATQGTIGDGEPTPEDVAKPRATEPDRGAAVETGARCFACVRICPETVSDADCGESYDTICGWGRSTDRSVAAEIANAECNGALELARDGSRYSSISGQCPAATCQ